jgi:hypothetical protein
VVAAVVGPGPAAADYGTFNTPYVSLTICQPGTSTCGTIDNVLIDTGSSGLRIFASVLAAAGVNLPVTVDPANSQNTIAECLAFVDGYVWGAVATGTLQVGGETASNLSINVIDDNSSYAPTVPTACTTQTVDTSLNSVADFLANGVMGVGVYAQDCGEGCATCSFASGGCTSSNDIYFSCNGTSDVCASTQVALNNQVVNPVTLFATDNNGVILQFPTISTGGGGAPTATGSLIFGIGTQANNVIGTAFVLAVDGESFFTSTFNSKAYSSSFIDSGSNAYFLTDNLPACGKSEPESEFYCPTTTQTLSALNQGHLSDGAVTGLTSTVSFYIGDLNSISNSDFAIDDAGGTAATSNGTSKLSNDVDFGFPFFYGREVFTAIQDAPYGSLGSGPTGPYYAYTN